MNTRKSLPFRKRIDEKASPELKYVAYLSERRIPEYDFPLFAAPDEGSGVLYKWAGTHWQMISPFDCERMAWKWLTENSPNEATPRKAQSCSNAACLEIFKIPSPQKTAIVIPTKSGYLHIGQTDPPLSLLDADPALGITYCLNCAYDPEAPAPLFKAFAREILPDPDVRDLVQEYAGYTLLGDTRYQKAQWWIGAGANGKGTLAQIVAALHQRASALSIDSLDGFRLVPLLDATLIYVDETPKRIDEQRLKTLLSGDLVSIDRKYRDPVSFRPIAKWIVLGNDLPAISDQSDGFWRRWHVIPFPVSFTEENQKPLLAKQIIEDELSGVLNWALDGLLRLLGRGHFLPPPRPVREAILKGKKDTDNVLGWIEDVEPAVTGTPAIPKDDIYTAYREWSFRNGTGPVSSTKFWTRIRQIYPEIVEEREGSGKRRRMVNVVL